MQAYGLNWRCDSQIDVEIRCIQLGGKWQEKSGRWYGEGLFHHYKSLQSLLWPWKKWDRWSELILKNLLENRLTLLAGPANSSKTHSVSAFIMARYICFPVNNCTLVSSTDSRSLELRIWGEIKKLWNEASLRYPETPGRMVESKQMLVTDIEEHKATDYRNGIIGIPCMVGGTFQGLGKYTGIKSGSVFLAGDELSFMPAAFFDAISNMSKNAGFKCAGMLNPKDQTDVAGKLAEPVDGWESYAPTGKTMVWKTKFAGGKCIQLDGRDSPNNEAKPGEYWPYVYLINRDDIARDVAYYGEDSIQVSMMDYGIFPKDAQARRVITSSMCERFRACEEPVWTHEPLKHLLAIDAAYGAVGGDRCVAVELAFGKCSDGVERIAFAGPPMVIPVKADAADENGSPILPEDQIVNWTRAYCENPSRTNPIPLAHIGFDSTGRGSLVKRFADLWGTDFYAIEFGGPASDLPVSVKIQTPRSDYYANKVTELWFDVAVLILADQCRAMPTSVKEEGCLRGWEPIKDKKIQVEPKNPSSGKPGMKQRTGKSPDLFDATVVGVSLAQKLGFVLGDSGTSVSSKVPRWMEKMLEDHQRLQSNCRLRYH